MQIILRQAGLICVSTIQRQMSIKGQLQNDTRALFHVPIRENKHDKKAHCWWRVT